MPVLFLNRGPIHAISCAPREICPALGYADCTQLMPVSQPTDSNSFDSATPSRIQLPRTLAFVAAGSLAAMARSRLAMSKAYDNRRGREQG